MTSKLLSGEKITFDKHKSSGISRTDEEVDAKYVSGEIRMVTETARYPLNQIEAMIGGTNYNTNPEYQRRHRWSVEKKSRLIESFIMNVPIPPIFLYEIEYAKYEVMDGRQRLTTISEFYGNKFKLTGLQYWKELESRDYSTLPPKVKSGIDRRHLSSIILLNETAKDENQAKQLKQIVFERLNSGGVQLEPQETRNAVYDGPMNRLCLRLSENATFRRLWNIRDAEEIEQDEEPTIATGRSMYETMDDVELVLRFFAYRQMPEVPDVSLNKLSNFLDSYLNEGNKFSSELLSQLEDLFIGSIELVADLLGETGFCRWETSKSKWSKRPNKIIYDPIMYIMSSYVDDVRANKLKARRDKVVASLKAAYTDHDTYFAGRRTNRSDMIKRNEIIGKAVSDAFNTK